MWIFDRWFGNAPIKCGNTEYFNTNNKFLFTTDDNLKFLKMKVPILWHKLRNGNIGKIYTTQINDRINRLNRLYPFITFYLSKTYTHYDLPVEFNLKSGREYLKNLRQDGYLNIISGKMTDFAGYSSFPWESLDGILINYRNIVRPDTLTTLSHEVGHWLGLWHTFQKPTDEVDDTPSCTESTNCSGPCKFNIMSYSSCGKSLTTGQYDRIKQMCWKYRRNFIE